MSASARWMRSFSTRRCRWCGWAASARCIISCILITGVPVGWVSSRITTSLDPHRQTEARHRAGGVGKRHVNSAKRLALAQPDGAPAPPKPAAGRSPSGSPPRRHGKPAPSTAPAGPRKWRGRSTVHSASMTAPPCSAVGGQVYKEVCSACHALQRVARCAIWAAAAGLTSQQPRWRPSPPMLQGPGRSRANKARPWTRRASPLMRVRAVASGLFSAAIRTEEGDSRRDERGAAARFAR